MTNADWANLAAYTHFRCVADDGLEGFGSLPPNYEREHILVTTANGLSFVEVSKITPISKEERDAGLQRCYQNPAWALSAGF